MTMLSSIDINPTTTPIRKCVIWLHGLGADGNDFVPIASELRLPSHLGVRFVFPHAPEMPITINNHYKMRAWFDIYSVDILNKIDLTGINISITEVNKLIEHEMTRGLTSSDIILAGFSQGGVIAMMAGLQYPLPLGGILSLSSFLPLSDGLLNKVSAANQHIPMFIAHGTEDSIVPYALGEMTCTALSEAGYPVTWKSYPMPHSVCAEEVIDIRQWLVERFNQP